ncbi:MAG: hypothetical protein KME46_23225 [Brasilonema angustatum HA4187-MV1]|nr:hypothetical protein [Brasilonema angustatum HA4187-MV1]
MNCVHPMPTARQRRTGSAVATLREAALRASTSRETLAKHCLTRTDEKFI